VNALEKGTILGKVWSLAVGAGLAAAAVGAGAQGIAIDLPSSGTVVRAAATSPTLTLAETTTGTLALLKQIEAAQAQMQWVHAAFEQTRRDELFDEVVKSKGELWFDKPTAFRCDYAAPDPMTVLVVDKSVYFYSPSLEQADKWEFETTEERDRQMHQLMIAFGFKTQDLLARYTIHSSEDEAAPAAELEAEATKAGWKASSRALVIVEPRPEFAADATFRQLKVYIDKASLLPEKIWYRDPSDAQMTLDIKRVERDKQPSPGLFDTAKVIPKGTEIIDRRAMQ
jgi:outer membrane lipoprotein-sorting protein